MKKLHLSLVTTVILSFTICKTTWADDTGSCGNNCVYYFDSATGTLTYSVANKNANNGEAQITSSIYYSNINGQPYYNYGNSDPGIIKNVIIEEGITAIPEQAEGTAATIRNVGSPDGKLVLPSTLRNFGKSGSYLLGFGTVEINSTDLLFEMNSFKFREGTNTKIIMSPSQNITFDENAFYRSSDTIDYPSQLTIVCKSSDPEACRNSFGTSLASMDTDKFSFTNEIRDDKGNLLGVYTDNGHITYDKNRNITGTYDTDGKLISAYQYDGGGNLVAQYDKDGKLIYAKNIYTPAEAANAVHDGNTNTVSITW